MTVIAKRKAQSVKFYLYGRASNQSDFGAHEIRFHYAADFVERHFYNLDGQQTSNNAGVFAERYPKGPDGHYHSRIHFDKQGNRIEDKFGVATYQIVKRDDAGRRTIVRHLNQAGQVIADRFNGFFETRFGFDENARARFRKSFDQHGNHVNGQHGYATAYFWFDKHGTFKAEEFRDAQNALVDFRGRGYARLTFSDVTEHGQIQRIRYFEEHGAPASKTAATAVLTYDELGRRDKIAYFDAQGRPALNYSGVAGYQYVYRRDLTFEKRLGFDLSGTFQ